MSRPQKALTEDLECRFDKAIELTQLHLSDFEENVGQKLANLESVSFIRALIGVLPGIRTHVPTPINVFYDVEPSAAAVISGAASSVPEAAEILREICASNIFEGHPIPPEFRPHASLHMRGRAHFASRPGKPAGDDFFLKWLLRGEAQFVADACDLALTRSPDSKSGIQMSACDAVSMTVLRQGVDVPPDRLIAWCNHRDHQAFRSRADALTNLHKDIVLHRWGLLRRMPTYGVFHELPHMNRRD